MTVDALLQSGNFFVYIALALTAFADTLIGVGFFVFGEVAFLAAGAMLAAASDWTAVMVVMVFAWLGDMASFALGRRYGFAARRRFLRPLRRRRAWRRASRLLERYGAPYIVLSRLMGPVAWVTPFLAGSLRMPPGRFAPAAAMGVLLGVGQFVVLGALGMEALNLLPEASLSTAALWLIPILALVSTVALVAAWRLIDIDALFRWWGRIRS